MGVVVSWQVGAFSLTLHPRLPDTCFFHFQRGVRITRPLAFLQEEISSDEC